MNVRLDLESESSERSRLLTRALSRWDNDGGASGECVPPASEEVVADALPLTNAELVQLQTRVIALENLLSVLLVNASDRQLNLACEIAEYISPRPGCTPHPLTIHAAARMISLIERAGHLRSLQSSAADVGDPPLCRTVVDIGDAE